MFKGTKNEVKLGDYYNREKDDEVYEIGVKLYMGIRFKFGWIKTKKIKPMIKCDLKGHKNATDLDLMFKGTKNEVKLGDYYNGEKDDEVYEIGVKLYMGIRFKFGWIKTKKIKPMIKCDLKVPFKGNGTFEITQCHLDW
ncbi:NDR1/HIN1-like protein 2 [Lycium ferocissimum]|uniref:NDR1/HIN1-like protein 2 n=1 Tax=Lycium ferocissimum TaxID=112874 RepID=UPI00281526E3|nr:NDR1/HIN1-like protein 2 [Lycium ferocissimum]